MVDTMTELEFAPVPVGIHIIRNRGAPQTDCGCKNFTDRLMERRWLSKPNAALISLV